MISENAIASNSPFDALCHEERWSCSALGRKLGVHRNTVWRWRRPIGSPQFIRPSDENLAELHRIFCGRVDGNTFVNLPPAFDNAQAGS